MRPQKNTRGELRLDRNHYQLTPDNCESPALSVRSTSYCFPLQTAPLVEEMGRYLSITMCVCEGVRSGRAAFMFPDGWSVGVVCVRGRLFEC